MSQISTEWRECSIMTLSTIYWVWVQDKGSKILCGKLGAMKITSSDCLHQEYLTINLGSTSDCQKLKLPLVRIFWRCMDRCWPAGAAWGRECRRRSSVLPLNRSDTAATRQDGSSLEFIAAIASRQCNIQDASGRGLWQVQLYAMLRLRLFVVCFWQKQEFCAGCRRRPFPMQLHQ